MRSVLRLVSFILFISASVIPAARADIPSLLAWQGVALDSNNAPVTDSTYGFTFRIYDDGAGGNLLWQESQLVTTENGVLNVLLGSDTPIPDTVFNGPTTYLEVQFGVEPPYSPRTQIVSVGYAYRVDAIDGARGGALSSSIEIRPDSGIGTVSLYSAGGVTPGAHLSGTGNGGSLTLYDEVGNPTLWARQDYDGSGGWLTVYSDAGTGRGSIFENGYGSGNPLFYMLGDSSYIELNAGTTDNASVILPNNAVSALETMDEPGLAAGSQTSGTVTTTNSVVASATATFPASGYAVVICEATFRAETANNWMTAYLYQNGGFQSSWYWDPGDVDVPSPYYDQRQTYVFTGAVSAGMSTYELRLKVNTGTAQYQAAKVTIMYFPTSYGTVASPTVTNDFDAGQYSLPTATQVDVQAEREESIRFNQERIERELADMKQRMQRLENQLRENAESPRDER